MRIPLFSLTLSNTRMKTIDQIRRENLTILRDECGGVGKLAERLERGVSQVSQWLNASLNSATGKPRNMNDETCRYIEEKMGKQRGWMDAPHLAVEQTDENGNLTASEVIEMMALFVNADKAGRQAMLDMGRAISKLDKSAALPTSATIHKL